MKYYIRKATKYNWHLYKKIRIETLKQEPQAFSSTYKEAVKFSTTKWQEIISNLESIYLLVFADKKVIGVGRITFNDPEESENIAVLGGIYVNKSYRKLGLGRQLLTNLIDTALKRKNIKSVRLNVKQTQIPAIALYKDCGFLEISKIEDELIMEKLIA